YCSLPLDAEEMLARLQVFVSAKLSSDRAQAEGLVDPSTGFYDVQGILLRVRELGLAARRHARALGCVTVACSDGGPAVQRMRGITDIEPCGGGSSRISEVL